MLVLLVVHLFLPQRSGIFALTQVFEPFIVLATLFAVPVALFSTWRPAIYLAAAFVAVALIRYEPLLWSPAVPPGRADLKVVAWNVEAGARAGERVLDGLATPAADAQLVGLVELQPAMADALTADVTIGTDFPYRVFFPDSGVTGVGLLSSYPITDEFASQDPPFLRAMVETPETAQPTVVYVVHPLPARIRTIGDVPMALDTARRDADLARIRTLVEVDLAAGRPVIVLGDLNTTEREPAYAEFTRGLTDAHLAAGWGPGFTWRPGWLPSPPFGVLRIDYVLTSPPFRPASTALDCSAESDHCVVSAALDY